jgi:long-chain acyl-CoA synthetase
MVELHYGVGDDANLPRSFFEAASRYPEKTLLVGRRFGSWSKMSYAEVEDQVRRFAVVLLKFGVKSGDKVFISAENRPEWVIADLAIMSIGAVVVPSFITNTEDDFHFVMSHSDSVICITSGGGLADRVARAASRCSGVRGLVVMDSESPPRLSSKNLDIFDWGEELAAAILPPNDIAPNDIAPNDIALADLNARVERLRGDDVCCFIYTSGTGGRPKGVMLTHRSIQSNVTAASAVLEQGGVGEGQRFLSLLPLSHSYEHTAGLYLPIQTGSEIWYCAGADQIAHDLQEVSPSLMLAVPRLYEVLHDRIIRGVKAKGGLSERLFNAAVSLGVRRYKGERLSWFEVILDRILDYLVRAKVKRRFGGRLKYFISGGAALTPEIGYFFTGLGVNILQGYGLTEASPLISVNRPGAIRIETVGRAVDGVEVRLTEEGEIIARGDLLMAGYWKDPEATAQAIIDGWLYSGDLGFIDGAGYITISGRKKDIIVNSGGDNIAPSRVESVLTLASEIDQAMVYGDKRPWLVAVIVAGSDSGAVEKAVRESNRHLSKIEQVRRFIIADEPFTVANGQMTPTLKARRHVIRDVYAERLEALYARKRSQ